MDYWKKKASIFHFAQGTKNHRAGPDQTAYSLSHLYGDGYESKLRVLSLYALQVDNKQLSLDNL
jgi:hypothetical protein